MRDNVRGSAWSVSYGLGLGDGIPAPRVGLQTRRVGPVESLTTSSFKFIAREGLFAFFLIVEKRRAVTMNVNPLETVE